MSMAITQSRLLGSFERAQALTAEHSPFNLVVVIRLAGSLERETLRGALDGIQRRHALLHASLAGSGRGRAFELGGAREIPLRGVERRSDDGWREVVEEELGTPVEASGPLLRCVQVGQGEGTQEDGGTASEVVLTFHHVIVDAVSARLLVRELLALCSGAPLAGEAVEGPPGKPLPPGADEIFPPAYRAPRRWLRSARFLAGQLADEAAYRWRTRDRPTPPVPGEFRCRVLSLALGEAETAALVRATRRRRVGLFAALSAAMLLAVVRRRYADRAGPHRYFAFPLLRPYLSPPVSDGVVAAYLTTLRLTLPVAPDAGLWAAAGRIHRQVDEAVKRGERFLASVWSAFSMATVLRQRSQRMGTTALNYAGATPLEAGAGAPFSVAGFHAFVGNFPLGPEYTAQARIFDRRLWWDVVYLDVDMSRAEALAIAEEMRALLRDAVGRPGAERT
jgi:hypothetical protein